MRRTIWGWGLAVLVVACGSSSSDGGGNPASGSSGGASDAGPDATTGPVGIGASDAGGGDDAPSAPLDAGDPSQVPDANGYACAKHAPVPPIKYWGGPILHHPEVVTVTFASLDATVRSAVENFGDTITTTSWWDTVLAGYCDTSGNCIGHGTNGGHVVLDETPAGTYSDSQTPGQPRTIVDFIQQHIDAGTFPPPHEDTLYALYFPSSTTITLDGAASCQSYGGYHFAADVKAPADAGGATVRAAYAILPECDTSSSAADSLIGVASHEFIEAATDAKSLGPDIRNADWGFYMEDPAWGILWGGQEVGDLCESYAGPTVNGSYVVRGWMHDIPECSVPCGPGGTTDSYFGAAPEQQIIELAVGEETVVNVTAFSQAPRAGWLVAAVEPSQGAFGSTGYGGHLQMSWEGGSPVDGGTDPTQVMVNNGTQLKLHIKLLSAPPEDQNFPDQSGKTYNHAFAYLASRVDKTHHFSWPFTVRQKQ